MSARRERGPGWGALLKVLSLPTDALRVSSPRQIATHATAPRRPPPPAGAVVALVAVALAAALVAVSAATSSAWPGALLPVLAVALGAAAVGQRAVVVGVAALEAGALVSLRWDREPLAVVGMGLAVAVSAGVVTLWRLQRRRAARALDAERARTAELTVVDELTGCYNTHGLHLLGEHVLAVARRSSGAVHCALVEVEGVAPVLDALGAGAVEEVVIAVSEALRRATRGTDVVCRSGEATFAVVGPGSGMGALDLERRLRGSLLRTPPLSLREWPCTVLVGVGQLQPWDSGGLGETVARAEEDLSLRRALRGPALDPETARIIADTAP